MIATGNAGRRKQRSPLKTLRRPSRPKVPKPPGATVQLQHATGTEPELLLHRAMLDAVCGVSFPYPEGRFVGRGIVICGGGEKYLPSVYVLVRLLRHLRCSLPIEVWHLGADEMPDELRSLLAEHGAVCVDGAAVRRVHPVRRLGGWELKCHALMHCAFAEVLLLDADNCPVRNPEFLFRTPQYAEHGAIFWPDYTRFAKGQAVWLASGIPYRDEPEFESGQIVVDKARCWRALNVAMHLNEHSDWWYRVVHGDKDTFHLAWRKIGQTYAMPAKPVEPLEATMLQFDFAGRRLFQHRNFAKWKLDGNRRIPGFRLEEECLTFAAELRARWVPGLPLWVRKWDPAKAPKPLRALAAKLCRAPLDYVRLGHGTRPLEFCPDGSIGLGAEDCERWWDLRLVKTAPGSARTVQLEVFGQQGLTFRARRASAAGQWRGAWVAFERCKVTLRPIIPPGKRCRK
ncbi:MAG: hypothetical protein ABI318_00745 [Chthoniobacteraceae bacterium]